MHLLLLTAMVTNSHHQEKTLKIEKKNLESRKISQSPKKIYEIEKNIPESRKKFHN